MMTREEFEHAYNGGNYERTLEAIRRFGFASIECSCGDDICEGWKLVPLSEITKFPSHLNTDAERAAALEHRERLLASTS